MKYAEKHCVFILCIFSVIVDFFVFHELAIYYCLGLPASILDSAKIVFLILPKNADFFVKKKTDFLVKTANF